MESIKLLFESSTIHGLTHIATARKFARLFWSIIVVLGFTGAGVLINTSFDAWSKNPVSTTIETYPIDELKHPKVTVCPPKNMTSC